MGIQEVRLIMKLIAGAVWKESRELIFTPFRSKNFNLNEFLDNQQPAGRSYKGG